MRTKVQTCFRPVDKESLTEPVDFFQYNGEQYAARSHGVPPPLLHGWAFGRFEARPSDSSERVHVRCAFAHRVHERRMVEIEVDGRKVEVPEGSMLMEAANRLDIYVPHFCYHKKLSIAANCRMCLVEVEKAPKPLPACATPVDARNDRADAVGEGAKQAQNSVMEFLLINHPLDCPICDQGGECQLQDLAVGYGGSASRYAEAQARRVPQEHGSADLGRGDDALHPLHTLRAFRTGDRRRSWNSAWPGVANTRRS